MDSLTQIVLGAGMGELVLGKKVGNKAMFWGAIGGTIPDLDVLASPFLSDIESLAFHRGYSHSLLFGLLFPFIIAWLPTHLHRSSNDRDGIGYKKWVWLFIAAIITHPLLDSFTAYGTQLFLPFSDYRVAFNSVSIIDPLYTFPFLISLIIAARHHRSDRRRYRWARLGIAWSCAYLLVGLCIHQYVHKVIESNLVNENWSYSRYTITPTLFNNALWNIIVESDEHFTLGFYSVFDNEAVFSDRIDIDKNHQLIEPYKYTHEIKTLKWFTNNYFATRVIDGQLELNDIRYGRINPGQPVPSYVFTFQLTPTVDGLNAKEFRATPDEPGGLIRLIWERIFRDK